MEKQSTELIEQFQEAIGFTDEDLASNRAGMMSSRQVEEWRAKAGRGKQLKGMQAYGIALAIFGILTTVGMAGYFILELSKSSGGRQFGIPIVLLVLLIFAVWIVTGVSRSRAAVDQMLVGTLPVKRYSGKVKPVFSSSTGNGGGGLFDPDTESISLSPFTRTIDGLMIGRMRVIHNDVVEMVPLFEKRRKYHLYGVVLGPNQLTLLSAEPAE